MISIVFFMVILPAGGDVFLDDDFTNGDPLLNDGIGADWVVASSYHDALHTPHSETGTEVKLSDATKIWNVGGIKSDATYAAGLTASIAVTGFGGVDASSATFDRGNGLATAESASLNITDYTNTEGFPNAYANSGLAGMGIEINYDPGANALGYAIWNSTMDNYGDYQTHSGVFDDPASDLSIANPLIIQATPKADGTCTIRFNWTYDGGSSAPIVSTLSVEGNGLLTDDLFILAIGAQGIGTNNGWVTFDSANVEYVEVILIPGDANGDGKVDADDAARLADNWLADNATWEMGDFNEDEIVNELDATLLAANWQTGVVASASVPEPSALILILGALSLLVWRRMN